MQRAETMAIIVVVEDVLVELEMADVVVEDVLVELEMADVVVEVEGLVSEMLNDVHPNLDSLALMI